MHAGCPSTTIKVAASVHAAKKTTGFLVHLRCAVVHQECHSIFGRNGTSATLQNRSAVSAKYGLIDMSKKVSKM